MAASRALIQRIAVVPSSQFEAINGANSPGVVVNAVLDPFPGSNITRTDLKLECVVRKLTDFTTTPPSYVELGTFDLKVCPGDSTGRNWVGFSGTLAAHGLSNNADAPVQFLVRLKADYAKAGVIVLDAAKVQPCVETRRWKRVDA